jgi:hypothetical protein
MGMLLRGGCEKAQILLIEREIQNNCRHGWFKEHTAVKPGASSIPSTRISVDLGLLAGHFMQVLQG